MRFCTGLSDGFAASIHIYVLLSKLVQLMDDVVCMVIDDSFGILYFLVNFNCDFGNPQNGYVAECTKTRMAAFYQ